MSSSEVDKLNGIEFDGNSLTIEIAQKRDNSFSTPRSGGKGNDGGDRSKFLMIFSLIGCSGFTASYSK